MKPIVRCLAIAALVCSAAVAQAQPATGSGSGSATANGSGSGSAIAPTPAPATGSATTPTDLGRAADHAAGTQAGSAELGGTVPAPPISPVAKGTNSGSNDMTGTDAARAAPGGPAAAGKGPAVAWYDQLAQKPIDDESTGTFWMPNAVNKVALDSDGMFYAVLGLSAFFFFAIAIAVVYLVIKYRHRPGHKPEPSPAHNDALEITWTIIPTIICVFLFYYGWRGYVEVVTPPTKAVEIQVLAQRWSWNFTHENGVQDGNLHVPVNTPVRLVMTSKDVLHSFYIPVMRVKQDIVPRRYTYAWFYATTPGTYRLNCAEYCGTNHSQMGIDGEGRRAVVVVHEPGGYERYLSDKASESLTMDPVELGKKLYEKKNCISCHTVDGSPRVGPTWLHDFGTMVPLGSPPELAGTSVKMDENYIRESILYPQAKSRPGYPPSMPSFEGQLKEKEIQGIIAYFKSLQ